MSQRKANACHLCLRREVVPNSRVVCSLRRCSQMFCLSCVQTVFEKNFDVESHKPGCWICFSCVGVCKCERCCGALPSQRKPRIGKKIEPVEEKTTHLVDLKKHSKEESKKDDPKKETSFDKPKKIEVKKEEVQPQAFKTIMMEVKQEEVPSPTLFVGPEQTIVQNSDIWAQAEGFQNFLQFGFQQPPLFYFWFA